MSREVRTYFIQSGSAGAIKIGISGDPRRRMADLQTAHPEKLRLLGILEGDCERELHKRFKDHRKEGEWFDPANELIDYIVSAAGLDKAIAKQLRRAPAKTVVTLSEPSAAEPIDSFDAVITRNEHGEEFGTVVQDEIDGWIYDEWWPKRCSCVEVSESDDECDDACTVCGGICAIETTGEGCGCDGCEISDALHVFVLECEPDGIIEQLAIDRSESRICIVLRPIITKLKLQRFLELAYGAGRADSITPITVDATGVFLSGNGTNCRRTVCLTWLHFNDAAIVESGYDFGTFNEVVDSPDSIVLNGRGGHKFRRRPATEGQHPLFPEMETAK